MPMHGVRIGSGAAAAGTGVIENPTRKAVGSPTHFTAISRMSKIRASFGPIGPWPRSP